MVSLLVRVCLLIGCLVLPAGSISAPITSPAYASPEPAGRNCGSTTLLAHSAGPAGKSPFIQNETRWDDSRNIAIGTPTAPQRTPAVAVAPDGTLHMLFTDERNGNDDIYAARSSDDDQTWSAGMNVSDDVTGSRQTNPAGWIAPDNTVHVVWNDNRGGLNDIYTARSSDGGQTWSANIRVNLDTGTALKSAPLLTGTSDALLAGWVQKSDPDARRGDLVAVRSTDGGQTWIRVNRINILANAVLDGGFSLIADPATGRLYAAWIGIPAGSAEAIQVLMSASDDDGQTWSDPMQVNDPAEDAAKAAPALAVDTANNLLLVAWEDYREFAPVVRLVSSSDGQTWSSSIQVSADDGAAYTPRLVIDSRGTGHCIFCQENTTGGHIYAAEIDRSNRVMREQISADPIGAGDSLPALTINDKNTLYAFWTNSTVNGEGIFTARRSDISQVFLPLIQQ
jgi:hypothetical protein